MRPRTPAIACVTDSLSGQGGPRSIFTFWFFLIEGDASYQELFPIEKILFLAEVIALSNLKITYNYTNTRTANTISRKLT